jgi:hypothetical protein
MRALVFALAACGPPAVIHPSAPIDLPAQRDVMIDTTPKERRRMVPPEVYLRAYMTWFGGLAPLDVQNRARPKALFDAWDDYLAALGLPDYRADLPRAIQSNTLMLATLGRLGEALCLRAAEHDLHDKKVKPEQRLVFRFEVKPAPSVAEFGERFDVLHRMFLGYPAALAPADRVTKFHALYDHVVARHADRKKPLLGADETAWATICSALVQHPETELY